MNPAADTAPARLTGTVHHGWPTPVYRRLVGDTAALDELTARILDREADDTSRSLGVVHARKSAPDLLAWDLPGVELLRTAILDATAAVLPDTAASLDHGDVRLDAHAWAVVYRDDGQHHIHAHHDSAVSGVLYLRTGFGGALELHDPRTGRLAGVGGPALPRTIRPEPGLLVAFPSWLRHSVAPHHGPGLRICVAFNASFAPTAAARATGDPAGRM